MKRFVPLLTPVTTIVSIALLTTGGLWVAAPAPGMDIIPFGSEWRYLHLSDDSVNDIILDPLNDLDSSDFNNVWFTPTYDESDLRMDDGQGGIISLAWQGPSPTPLGYGVVIGFVDGLATEVPKPDTGERYTLYLRKEFHLSDSAAQGPLEIEWLCDDGMAVYIDGEQVARKNCCEDVARNLLPLGTNPVFLDRAPNSSDEVTYTTEGLEQFTADVNPGFTLAPGDHTIAISLHNLDPNSSDLGFDFRLSVPEPSSAMLALLSIVFLSCARPVPSAIDRLH